MASLCRIHPAVAHVGGTRFIPNVALRASAISEPVSVPPCPSPSSQAVSRLLPRPARLGTDGSTASARGLRRARLVRVGADRAVAHLPDEGRQPRGRKADQSGARE